MGCTMKRSNISLYFFGLIFISSCCHALAGTVYKEILREGTGPVPQVNQTVIVHYTGTLQSGGKFDSSHDRNEPFKFRLGVGEVIRGWDAGVSSMKVGERARIEIAPEDGYGVEGLPPVIPRSATLMFDIELLGIEGVSPPIVEVKNKAPVDPSGQTIPGVQPDPAYPSFPSGPDQTFGVGTSQGRIFTPPDLLGSNNLGQPFGGNKFSSNQILRPSQQTPGGPQGIASPGNPSQGQSLGAQNSLNPGLTRGSLTNQGQNFNPPNNLLGSSQLFGSGQSQGFPQAGISSPSQIGARPFSGNPASPSQDISRMSPVLTPQGRPDFTNFPQLPSDWNQGSAGASASSLGGAGRFSPEQLPPQFANQGGSISQGSPPGQSSGFRPPSDRDSFPSRRFEPSLQQGRAQNPGSRGNAPDPNNFDRQNLPTGQRMPSTGRRSFGPSAPRERLMPDGMDFAASRMPSSRFDGPGFPDPRMMGDMDPSIPGGDLGPDPAFQGMFPGREFPTGSRRMRRPSPEFFRSRGGGFPRDFRSRDPAFGGMGRFPDIDPRAMRGFSSRRFRRDRDPFMMMMMERARRARMRRGF